MLNYSSLTYPLEISTICIDNVELIICYECLYLKNYINNYIFDQYLI